MNGEAYGLVHVASMPNVSLLIEHALVGCVVCERQAVHSVWLIGDGMIVHITMHSYLS